MRVYCDCTAPQELPSYKLLKALSSEEHKLNPGGGQGQQHSISASDLGSTAAAAAAAAAMAQPGAGHPSSVLMAAASSFRNPPSKQTSQEVGVGTGSGGEAGGRNPSA